MVACVASRIAELLNKTSDRDAFMQKRGAGRADKYSNAAPLIYMHLLRSGGNLFSDFSFYCGTNRKVRGAFTRAGSYPLDKTGRRLKQAIFGRFKMCRDTGSV